VPVVDAGRLMGEMRVWLDRRRVVPTAFRCGDMDGRVEIQITFRTQTDAAACATEFEGFNSPSSEARCSPRSPELSQAEPAVSAA
jgi:hypothetical protein